MLRGPARAIRAKSVHLHNAAKKCTLNYDFFFFWYQGIKHRTLHLQSRCLCCWAKPLALIYVFRAINPVFAFVSQELSAHRQNCTSLR